MDTKPDPSLLGAAISTYRDLTGLTQDDISRRGGPSDVTIRGLERGAGKTPNAATLRKLDRGLGWPEGFAAKVLVGDADVHIHQDETGNDVPSLLDYTQMPERPPQSEEDLQAAYDSWRSEQPSYALSTAELLTEITGRFRAQETRIRELERQNAQLLEELEYRANRYEPTSRERAEIREAAEADLLTDPSINPDYLALAAKHGTSRLTRDDAEADVRGEESQDPGYDEPA